MIAQLPVELIEIILLSLGIYDLIAIAKANNLLYEITHSKKLKLKDRLEKRTSRVIMNLYAYSENPKFRISHTSEVVIFSMRSI